MQTSLEIKNSKKYEVQTDHQRNRIYFRDFISKKGSRYYRNFLVIPGQVKSKDLVHKYIIIQLMRFGELLTILVEPVTVDHYGTETEEL